MSALPVQVASATLGSAEKGAVPVAPALWQARDASTGEAAIPQVDALLERLFAVDREALSELSDVVENGPWVAAAVLPQEPPVAASGEALVMAAALPAMQVPAHWQRALQQAEEPVAVLAQGVGLARQGFQQAPALTVVEGAVAPMPSLAQVLGFKERASGDQSVPPGFSLSSNAQASASAQQERVDGGVLPAQVQPIRTAIERISASDTSPSAVSEVAAIPVQKGAQALVQALSQRIQVQQAQGMEVAIVRLDPPQMGSLEIRIRQDALGVQVQMHASNNEVARQLAGVAENLRQELLVRSSDATVTVASSRFSQGSGQPGEQQHAGRHPAREPEVGQALQAWDADSLT